MILSASRRTDIPAFYSDWFLNRIKAGFAYVRNPMNPRRIGRIDLSPEAVDCIVFWTKNPERMMERLEELRDYPFYFQFTLTGYGRELEPGVPDKKERMIPVFQKLSEKVGSGRVVWRYDPVLLSDRCSAEYHLKAFEEIAAGLKGYTERVVISFLDFYEKTLRNTAGLAVRQITDGEMIKLARGFAEIAGQNHLVIETCAEHADLSAAGIGHGCCIDKKLIEKIIGCKLTGKKDRNQRKECGCMESLDIGAYHTCRHGCRYCYANDSERKVRENEKRYNVNSPILCGCVGPEDIISDRKAVSQRDEQLQLLI